jgi:LacI family transcriptional regulator
MQSNQQGERAVANDLREVARRSGVSISTASRSLAGSSLVSAATRIRVEQVAAAVGYRPNASARALRTARSQLVGLVITNLVNNSFRVIAEIVQQRLAEAGHHLVLSITGGDPVQERAALHTLMELNASGVVVVGSDSKAFAEIRSRGIPVVHLGRRPGKLVGDCVLGDESAGARLAVDLLLAHGHRRVGIVCGPATVTSGRERLDGYRRALVSAGRAVAEELVVAGPFTAQTGLDAVKTFLALPRSRRPTALLVANHESAYGVLPALRELSIDIPGQMSVICYEDAPIMQWWSPAVTVVDNQPAQMAELVARLLMERVTGLRAVTTRPAVHRIPTHLVERGSVGSVPPRSPGP